MKQYRNEIFSFLMLMAGVLLEYAQTSWFALPYVSLVWFLAAVAPVGLPVMAEAWEHLMKKEYFSEFMLMTIATIGAFCIGEYPEGVAVMLFYAVGEQLQDSAVDKARDNIRALLDMRPRTASVFRKGQYSIVFARSGRDRRNHRSKKWARKSLWTVCCKMRWEYSTRRH